MINSTKHIEILGKLEKLINKEIFVKSVVGIVKSILSLFLVLFSFSLIELLFRFSTEIRTFLFFLILLCAISFLTYFILLPAVKVLSKRKQERYQYASYKVAIAYPSVKDELTNVLQLVNLSNEKIYSESLINAAFENLYTKVGQIDFSEIISFSSFSKVFKISSAVVISVFLSFLLSDSLSSALGRIYNYNTEYLPPQKFSFVVSPGDAQITKGESLLIRIKAEGDKPKKIAFNTKDETESSFRSETIFSDSLNQWSIQLNNIKNSFAYYVSAEGIESNQYLVRVIDRPIIQNLSLKISPPSYTGLPITEQADNGNITAYPGSNVLFSIVGSKKLSKAIINFEDSTFINLNVGANKADGKLTVRKNNSYWISLYDEIDNTNLSPILYSIKVLTDLGPTIDIISPNRSMNLGDDQRVQLITKISDDFGFTKLVINYRLSASKYEMPNAEFSQLEIPINAKEKEQIVNYVWNLSKLNLATEDVISYFFEVFDNDNINGPKSARTEIFLLRIPSIDEIFANADKNQNEIEKELIETLKDADVLKKELEQLSKDLKQDKKDITWQEKERIEKTVDSFEKLQQKVDELSQKLDETKNELQKNNLLSEQTLEKYMELQKLMDEMSSDEMKKAMEKLQKAIQNMDRKQTQEALQNMKFDEEQFQKSIERTLNLLKRIQIEQKMDAAVKRSNDIQNKQEQLEQQTQNSSMQSEQQRNELAKKQDEITKDLDKLEKEMKELQDKMKDFSDLPNKEMEKLSEEYDNQNNEALSEEAQEQLKNQQKQNAQKKQKQISQNMQKMNNSLMQMQQQMAQQNQMQVLVDLMKALKGIISISKDQEELKSKTSVSDQSALNRENMQRQSNLKANLDKILTQLSELSQKTFAVTPEMGKALGDARREMDKALDAMQNRNSHMTSNSQGESMKSLNEAAAIMKGSMDNMMQPGGQGGGMMSLMQQLGQMSGQQMQLNNLTQQLQQMMSGGQLSPETQGQIQRLAQQQELIQKSLEQLNKEARESGKSKSLPANLSDIINQMKEVVTDMKTDNLDDNLVQKQERILSKLLDAQRSINERDFEKERQSNTGQNVTRKSLGELNLLNRSPKDKFKDGLNKAVQEGYSKDYEDLIRKYYDNLQKEILK